MDYLRIVHLRNIGEHTGQYREIERPRWNLWLPRQEHCNKLLCNTTT